MPLIHKGHFRLNDDDTPVYMRSSIKVDLPYIRHIELKTYDNPWDDDTWLPKVGHVRVALINKRIVGFWYGDQVQDYIRILRIAVHPSWQRRGIGSILFHDLEQAYLMAKSVRVLVLEHQAESFYALKKNGYFPVENLGPIFQIPGMWEKESAYAFEKELLNR